MKEGSLVQAKTVALAIREAAARLAEASDTARLDAELLMAHALDVSRSDLLLRHVESPVPPGFAALVDRRAAQEPVAYITGSAGFYGRDFQVTRDVLIPRPDSETLIEVALEGRKSVGRILDLGTGSGALMLTLLAELPEATGIGVDVSQGAVAVARKNAARLDIMDRAQILRRDWYVDGWTDDLGTFDLIVCNPPYVEADSALDAEVRNYEPPAALFAGADGLDEYRILLPQIRALLRSGGVALFEIGSEQGDAVGELARQAGFATEIHTDIADRPRCVRLW